MKLRILIAGLVFGLAAALAAESGAELFQKAVTQERAAGNLEEAIKLYQRVAREFASDRPLVAKALVQAARCYEKLGQDKAVKIYEQVARDYGDQREFAAAANARLAALRQGARATESATMRARRIELPDPGAVANFTDGQRVIFRDRAGSIMISDLAGTNKRIILKKTGDGLAFMPSRDLSMLLLLNAQPPAPISMALIKTDGTGYREIGRLDSHIPFFTPSWSWDNRYVLVGDKLPDGSSHLLRITVADGQHLEVLPRQEPVIGSASFSPDGRFIAYTEGTGGSSKVLVLPSQGGESRLVSSESSLVDWTRDGRYLAINKGRPDSRALYLLPVKDGQAAGEPVFIRNGSIEMGLTSASGSLLYRSNSPASGSVFLGTLDADGRPVGWKPFDRSGLNPDPHPSWSPDSSQIAYIDVIAEAGKPVFVVRVRNILNGEDRDLYRAPRVAPACVWAAQHPKLYCAEFAGSPDSFGMLSIDVDSGRVERLGSLPGTLNAQPQPTRDDSALYMLVSGRGLVKWDIATQQETSAGTGREISPDERWVWGSRLPLEPPSNLALTLGLRPASGTEWRRVVTFRIDKPAGTPYLHVAFSPDGNWLYFHDRDSAGKDALFRIPTSGGEAERMGEFPLHTVAGQMKISPDGRKIVATDSNTNSTIITPELWLLENFEPKTQGAR